MPRISLPKPKKSRNRPPVLLPMTVRELADRVGMDTEVLVGRTRLAELLTERQVADLVARKEG